MCERCDAFFKPVPVGTGAAYGEQCGRVQAAVADEILELVDGTAPWPAAGPRPPTQVRHAFSCTACAQLFILERGGCSAFGDQWRPLYGN